MIIDLILSVILAPISALLAVLPTFTWPTWFDCGTGAPSGGVCAQAQSITDGIRIFDAWVPIDVVFTGATVVGTAWLLVASITAGRKVVSLLTGGGGA